MLLLLGPEGDERRPEQPLAEEADTGGGVGPRVLLVEDPLFDDGGAPAAVLLGPAEPDPAGVAELLLPGEPHVPAPLVGRPSAAAEGGVLASEVLAEPGTDLRAKAFLGLVEPEVHGVTLY